MNTRLVTTPLAVAAVLAAGALAAPASAADPTPATPPASSSATAAPLQIEISQTGSNTLLITNPGNTPLQVTLLLGRPTKGDWWADAGSEQVGTIPAGARDYVLAIPAAAHGRADGAYGVGLRITGTSGFATVVLNDHGTGMRGLENAFGPIPEVVPEVKGVETPTTPVATTPTAVDPTTQPAVDPTTPPKVDPPKPVAHTTPAAHSTTKPASKPAIKPATKSTGTEAAALPNTGAPVGMVPLALLGGALVATGGVVVLTARRTSKPVEA